MNKPLVALVSALGISMVIWGFSAPSLSEAEVASAFFQKNKKALLEAVSIAKQAKLPERIEEEDPRSFPPDCVSDCLSAYNRLIVLQREMGVPVIEVGEQCYRTDKCSIQFLISRRGIAISGSATQLIYDEKPDWGTFVIVPLAGAPKNWYFRHLQ
jgi:hypothetical protein